MSFMIDLLTAQRAIKCDDTTKEIESCIDANWSSCQRMCDACCYQLLPSWSSSCDQIIVFIELP